MMVMWKELSRTLPGLANFYLGGLWASANPGVTTAAKGARTLVMELCRRSGRKFTTMAAGA
jgi:hypothetical protein